jgi:two-component system sensor histidine kinase/response regulator
MNQVSSKSTLNSLATKPHVLVVDDTEVNLTLAGYQLGSLGYQVSFSKNGLLALEAVQQQSFDLILMDINMPVMDGLDATRAIRALPEPVCHIPIVVLTAGTIKETRETALAAGANDFLTKPVPIAYLRDTLARHLTQ